MFNQILVYSFLGTMALNVLGSMFDMISARSHALSAFKRKKASRRPLVTVLVYARNDTDMIERCLESLVKSSYRKHEIIVIDDASSDDTKKVTKNFIRNHPKKKIRLLARRRTSGRGNALNAGFSARTRGELILAIDAKSVVSKNAIRNSLPYFAAKDGLVAAVVAKVRVAAHPSIIGLFQRFAYLSRFRDRRFSNSASLQLLENDLNVIYRRDIFKKLKSYFAKSWSQEMPFSLPTVLGRDDSEVVYASDVIIHTEPEMSNPKLISNIYKHSLGTLRAILQHRSFSAGRQNIFSAMFNWLRLVIVFSVGAMASITPFMLTYFIFLGLSFNYWLFLAIGWSTYTAYLSFIVWTEEGIELKERLGLSFYIPVMFSVFYVFSVIRTGIIILSLINIKKLPRFKSSRSFIKPVKRLSARAST